LANNTELNAGTGGDTIATEDVAGVKYELVKLVNSTAGSTTRTGIAADPLHVQGTVTASGPLTDAQLRATEVPVSVATIPSHDVTNAGTFAVQESGGALTALQLMDDWDNAASDGASISGDVAHDAADAGEPAKVGGKALTADQTAVATADRTNALFDVLGKQVVHVGALNENILSGVLTKTDNTAGDVIAAQAAGVKIAVTALQVTNAHATVGTKVSIRAGTNERWKGYAAALGGGFVVSNGGRPIFITAAAEALTAICATTGADVDICASGYKTAV
jgi:hypothetical protein